VDAGGGTVVGEVARPPSPHRVLICAVQDLASFQITEIEAGNKFKMERVGKISGSSPLQAPSARRRAPHVYRLPADH